MTPERWRRVEELYQAALQQPSGRQRAFLLRECAGDESLRSEVESLLAQRTSCAVLDAATGFIATDDGSTFIGRRLGDYEIRARIGAGGMGEVYRAHDIKLGREVAIKTLPRLFASDPNDDQRAFSARLACGPPAIIHTSPPSMASRTSFFSRHGFADCARAGARTRWTARRWPNACGREASLCPRRSQLRDRSLLPSRQRTRRRSSIAISSQRT